MKIPKLHKNITDAKSRAFLDELAKYAHGGEHGDEIDYDDIEELIPGTNMTVSEYEALSDEEREKLENNEYEGKKWEEEQGNISYEKSRIAAEAQAEKDRILDEKYLASIVPDWKKQGFKSAEDRADYMSENGEYENMRLGNVIGDNLKHLRRQVVGDGDLKWAKENAQLIADWTINPIIDGVNYVAENPLQTVKDVGNTSADVFELLNPYPTDKNIFGEKHWENTEGVEHLINALPAAGLLGKGVKGLKGAKLLSKGAPGPKPSIWSKNKPIEGRLAEGNRLAEEERIRRALYPTIEASEKFNKAHGPALDDIVKNKKDWLTSDEYLARRMDNTGESPKAIKKDIEDQLYYLDNVKVELHQNSDVHNLFNIEKGKTIMGYAETEPQSIFQKRILKTPLQKKIVLNSIKLDDHLDALRTFEHEVDHITSPLHISEKLNEKYPTIKVRSDRTLKKDGLESVKYLEDPIEQQTRLNKLNPIIRESLGLDQDTKVLTAKHLSDWYNKHSSKLYKQGLSDVNELLNMSLSASENVNTYRKDLLKALNTAWGIATVATVGATVEHEVDRTGQFKNGGTTSNETAFLDALSKHIQQVKTN